VFQSVLIEKFLSLSAVDKNYSSSSADECELLPLLGGRRIVAAS
jgi:hypothetical protein